LFGPVHVPSSHQCRRPRRPPPRSPVTIIALLMMVMLLLLAISASIPSTAAAAPAPDDDTLRLHRRTLAVGHGFSGNWVVHGDEYKYQNGHTTMLVKLKGQALVIDNLQGGGEKQGLLPKMMQAIKDLGNNLIQTGHPITSAHISDLTAIQTKEARCQAGKHPPSTCKALIKKCFTEKKWTTTDNDKMQYCTQNMKAAWCEFDPQGNAVWNKKSSWCTIL
ncbi:hypothetical protein DFJ73DRAFT_864670, partial [Zopfochytrium polystomum]